MWSPPHMPVSSGEGPDGLELHAEFATTVPSTNSDRASRNGRVMIDLASLLFLSLSRFAVRVRTWRRLSRVTCACLGCAREGGRYARLRFDEIDCGSSCRIRDCLQRIRVRAAARARTGQGCWAGPPGRNGGLPLPEGGLGAASKP